MASKQRNFNQNHGILILRC